MTTIVPFILPDSESADLLRCAYSKKPLKIGFSRRAIKYWKWSIVRLQYVDKLSWITEPDVARTNAHLTLYALYSSITNRGKQVHHAINQGLVWNTRNHRASLNLTKRWYKTWLNHHNTGIPQTTFVHLSKIVHPLLLEDDEFKTIRSELILFKLRSDQYIAENEILFVHPGTKSIDKNIEIKINPQN